MAVGKLLRKAIASYNDFQEARAYTYGYYDWRPAHFNAETDFLERITCNYIRHQLTDYEDQLDTMFGKVGTTAGYTLLKEKITKAIAQAYPNLRADINTLKQAAQ
jgi:hypothetical protein